MTDQVQEISGADTASPAETRQGSPRRRGAAPDPVSLDPWAIPQGMSLAEHFGRFQLITDAHRQACIRPLPADSVQHAKAADSGKKYDATGHGYQWVADRLSEVFGPGGWTESHDNLESTGTWGKYKSTFFHIVCRMTLQVGHWTMSVPDGAGVLPAPVFVPVGQWISYGEHRADNRGDARKGAQTNALKKVAALGLGIGADAFRGSIDEDMAGTKPPDDPRERRPRPGATPADRAAVANAQDGVRFLRATRDGSCCLCEGDIQTGQWVAYPVAHPYTGKKAAAHRACYDREYSDGESSAPRTNQKGRGGSDGRQGGAGSGGGQRRVDSGDSGGRPPRAQRHPAEDDGPAPGGAYDDGAEGVDDGQQAEPDPDEKLPF